MLRRTEYRGVREEPRIAGALPTAAALVAFLFVLAVVCGLITGKI